MDVLKISKAAFGGDEYMKTLKVSPQNHARVKELSDMTNRQISEVANLLVEFALARVQITEEE